MFASTSREPSRRRMARGSRRQQYSLKWSRRAGWEPNRAAIFSSGPNRNHRDLEIIIMSAELIFDSPLVDTADHHRPLRESVSRLVSKFGRRYFQEVVASGKQPTELWKELGAAGFLGVQVPEAYGG